MLPSDSAHLSLFTVAYHICNECLCTCTEYTLSCSGNVFVPASHQGRHCDDAGCKTWSWSLPSATPGTVGMNGILDFHHVKDEEKPAVLQTNIRFTSNLHRC